MTLVLQCADEVELAKMCHATCVFDKEFSFIVTDIQDAFSFVDVVGNLVSLTCCRTESLHFTVSHISVHTDITSVHLNFDLHAPEQNRTYWPPLSRALVHSE